MSDYEAPEGTEQISMRGGDVVIVLSEEKNGFYMAEVEGRKGLVPVDHVGEYNPKHPVSIPIIVMLSRTDFLLY